MKHLPLPQPVDIKSQGPPLTSVTSSAVIPAVTATTPLLPLEDLSIAKYLLTRATSR